MIHIGTSLVNDFNDVVGVTCSTPKVCVIDAMAMPEAPGEFTVATATFNQGVFLSSNSTFSGYPSVPNVQVMGCTNGYTITQTPIQVIVNCS
jgi:hypothetical protein